MPYVKRTTKTGNTVETENYFVSDKKQDVERTRRAIRIATSFLDKKMALPQK